MIQSKQIVNIETGNPNKLEGHFCPKARKVFNISKTVNARNTKPWNF